MNLASFIQKQELKYFSLNKKNIKYNKMSMAITIATAIYALYILIKHPHKFLKP